MTEVTIVPFDAKFRADFYTLNIEWLRAYFYVEPIDEAVLSGPETHILNPGGHIFFAMSSSEVVGTVALMPTTEVNGFELTKMAVLKSQRGEGIGHLLIEHCIAFSKAQGKDAILLYSARKLHNAIHLYQKFGFVEVPLQPDSPYKRSDIKMILNL